MASATTYLKAAGVTVAFAYVLGLCTAGVFLAILWGVGKLPPWQWWEFALAPLWVGLIAIVGSWLFGPFVAKGRRWNAGISQWRRVGFLGFLVVLIAAYIFLWP